MQLQLLQYVIGMTFFTYHMSSALVTTFQFPTEYNQTVTQALVASPNDQTNLTEAENLTEADFWPVKDNYWLEIDTSDTYMDLKYVHSVLKRVDRTLGKRPAGQTITGVLSVTADRTVEPYNEGEFVFTAVTGNQVTFYLSEQGPEGRGTFGYGAMKRIWQPFPPSIAGNISVSR